MEEAMSECPCGIDRRDCEYHREVVAVGRGGYLGTVALWSGVAEVQHPDYARQRIAEGEIATFPTATSDWGLVTEGSCSSTMAAKSGFGAIVT